jgi:hypothetical protein
MTFIRFKVSLLADGTSVLDPDGNQVTDEVFRRAGSVGAPVPMVGLNLDWALTRRLVLRTYSRFFKLNLDAFNGGLNENGIHLNWYIIKNFGLAIGYDRTNLNVKELKIGEGNIMKVGYEVTGIGIYANMAF